ncbi:DUF2007 domain-containing protein [Vibrio marisflavi]|uniref:DUF2007 domain-containing protein n=1 Tax=Vibrio marisflavi CECT 7928 TaxID=634439 RepID=A0ABN8E1N8_9VIBR|nr:DUF2007 domain-containing protein [Vibrio marisflavi]CAH0538885.1 hypothetical protein VMF7928_01739 [Vibrio marisflavi CECT 7928]
MITVARFSFPHEAYIAKASLEAAGIDSFVADEHTINMQWLYSNAMGGVRLLVREVDLDSAVELLNTDFSESVVYQESQLGIDHCPNCGSDKLVPFTQGKKPAFIVFILLGFPLFFYKHGYRCEQCGEFTEKVK